MSGSVGLAEFIAQVRRELLQQPEGDATPILLLDEVQLEIQVAATKDVQGGINVHVVSLGAKAAQTATHTVRLKLLPTVDRVARQKALVEKFGEKELVTVSVRATAKDGERSQGDD